MTARGDLHVPGSTHSTSCQGEKTGAADPPLEHHPEFVELEDWEFEETVQEVERLVRGMSRPSSPFPETVPRSRTDPAHAPGLSSAKRFTTGRSTSRHVPESNPQGSIPWLVLAVGLGVFVCGTVLIGLAFLNQRPQLWQLGLPMLLFGQVAMLAAVIRQFEVIWHSNRATFVALHSMDQQLRELRKVSAQAESGSDAQEHPFYRHITEGASPQLLLADLKDQLDMLAMHLERDREAA